MSSLRWTYSNGTLSVSVDGEKPVIVRGENAAQLLEEIQNNAAIMDEETATSIYRRAVSVNNPIKKLIGLNDKKIVTEMRNAGIHSVGYSQGKVTFAGQPIRGAIGSHLKRVIERNENDLKSVNWTPIANFFNRLESNPTAAEQLFRWLSVNKFSLASDGRVICYKGVNNNYESAYGGLGGWITDTGESFYSPTGDPQGYRSHKSLVYAPGNTVYMLREDCDPNSNVHCSTGVHFGTQSYADDWGSVTMLCLVDPEDVVSIPNDDYRKARACRIEVVGELSRRGSFVEEPIVEFTENDEDGIVLHDATSANEIGQRIDVGFRNNKDQD